ncbi:hypothetical protein J7T55_010349 [Diaporthe amygdali]|uniref:uncharacterized protein n=1 Tax=Phomopsis amygdali TaxID=1214568 RepID=UPI0022FED3FA|nr:uncharacterized protein J7T55_010349 [Diaporthe amygdali]KAJ0115527.1 hypothetical protein J7T55_010349 [Diaporthe amygdali]
MDPVSAVGLASSILTFVDFAWSLLGGAVEIYRSVDGTLDENARLDDVKDDLDSLSDLLGVKPPCKTKAERRIARIAEDCRDDSNTLRDLLAEIAGGKNKRAFWRSLKASWSSIRSRKEIADLKVRLQEYRSEVLLHVTMLLREEQSSLGRGIAKIKDDCSQLRIEFRNQITSTQDEILDAIEALNGSTDEANLTSEFSLVDISKLLLEMQAEIHKTHLQHRVLRQLVYENMNSRAYQIPKAAQDTYKWTVEDGPVEELDQRRHAWQVFLEWLRVGDKILHVSGNAGSGKSTLMKFVSQHERTKEELKAWAASKTLIFCVFYFWNPGSMAQRTLTGLYSSLLFQALTQCPELMEEVFPVQIRRMETSTGDAMVERIQGFDEDDIEEAFNLLLSRASPDNYRLCFFIDGLDECKGNKLQHEDLAKMLQSWANLEAVKLCISSRPYSEFMGPLALPGNRQIQLHELNKSDIRAYCLDRLGKDVDAEKRGKLCRKLVEKVLEQAQGVFLWVHLVIDILLMGFRQHDPDSVLLARLEALPSDLDKLYAKLRESIETDSIQRTRSNRMLLLATHSPGPSNLTAMAFSWLDECDQGGLMNPNFPPASGLDPYSEDEISTRLDHVTKQINGLARGFLQTYTDGPLNEGQTGRLFRIRVQFCHRTARDYLLQTEDRRRAMLRSFPNFENSHLYTRIFLAEVIHGGHSKNPHSLRHIFTPLDQSVRQNADPDLVSKFDLPVQNLEPPRMLRLVQNTLLIPPVEGPAKVSFIAFAAYCGLDRFVLRESTRDITELNETSVSCNILLAALSGEHYNLALALLNLGKGMTQLCGVSENNEQIRYAQTLVPLREVDRSVFGGNEITFAIQGQSEYIEYELDSTAQRL